MKLGSYILVGLMGGFMVLPLLEVFVGFNRGPLHP